MKQRPNPSDKTLMLILGPSLFFILSFVVSPPADMSAASWHTLSVTLWVAVWWISEAVPIPVTSLLPMILFPQMGVMSLDTVTPAYADKIIWLYIGGFILALAIERWHLHERIALWILSLMGHNPAKLILGFMLACGLLSMWISNTATAIMMLPMGLAVIRQLHLPENHGMSKSLLLSIAYGCSIGGVATIIGTPTNLILAGIVKSNFSTEISFLDWFKLGFPIAALLMTACWWYLTRFAFDIRLPENEVHYPDFGKKLRGLGPIKSEEKKVLVVFVFTAICWIFRPFILDPFIPGMNDSIIAISAAVILFLIPAREPGEKLMNWDTAVKLPWGIVFLFGGGLAIASAFQSSGLAAWLGNHLLVMDLIPLFVMIVLVVTFVNFLTEVTSNVATAAMILPVLSAVSLSMGIHPYTLMVGATLAASCAFMLPVATPPNAIVFAGGHLKMNDMVKTGFLLNILSIIIICLGIYFMISYLWNIDLNVYPESFIKKG
jgi:sodium-dependent dicarboxylate transporter 2/3/5